MPRRITLESIEDALRELSSLNCLAINDLQYPFLYRAIWIKLRGDTVYRPALMDAHRKRPSYHMAIRRAASSVDGLYSLSMRLLRNGSVGLIHPTIAKLSANTKVIAPLVFDAANGSTRFRESWKTEAVMRILEDMRWSDDVERMPILADALEEAGCVESWLLDHLRDRERPKSLASWIFYASGMLSLKFPA